MNPTPLNTSRAVWDFLVKNGSIDARNYDQPLVEEMRMLLDLPEKGSFEEALEAGVEVERFVVAFFKAAEPYAAMMADLMTTFERAGVKRSNQAMFIDFDFGAGRAPLKFDLEHFRQDFEQWRSVSQTALRNYWNNDLLWMVQRALPNLNDNPANGEAAEWLRRYREEGFPSAAPPAPASANPALQRAINRLWRLVETVVHACAPYGTRRALREAQASGGEGDWPPALLWSIEGNLWTEFVVRQAWNLAEQAAAAPRPAIAPVIARLDDIWNQLPKAAVEVHALEPVLFSLLALPFWQKRHELYSTWVFTQILDALDGLPVRIHVVNGVLKFLFSGSHLATADTIPRLHVWAELRSPLENPRGKSRTNAIQPDYSLLIDPITDPASSLLEVECKQYLKASSRNFSDALTDYANGRPNAQVILVNYGPASETILDRVDPAVVARTHLVGEFRPARDAQKAEFRKLARAALDGRLQLPPPASVPLAIPAPAPRPLTGVGVIGLRWNDRPTDLDLHLRIEHDNGSSLIRYNERGDRRTFPYACLEADVTSGFGPERIHIERWLEGRYYCAVHNYSKEAPLAGCGALVEIDAGVVKRAFTCPASGSGEWWLVCSVDPETGVIAELNEIVAFPWKERILFEDDFFDNNNKWPETAHELTVRDHAYLFAHKRPDKSWLTWKRIDLDESTGFRIETTISRISGVEDSSCGLVWGLEDAGHLFAFCIREDGAFRVYREDANSMRALVDWRPSPHLGAGNAPFALAVEKRGDLLTFFINGHPVADAPFEPFFGPCIGFIEYSRIEILIHSMRVTQLYQRGK